MKVYYYDKKIKFVEPRHDRFFPPSDHFETTGTDKNGTKYFIKFPIKKEFLDENGKLKAMFFNEKGQYIHRYKFADEEINSHLPLEDKIYHHDKYTITPYEIHTILVHLKSVHKLNIKMRENTRDECEIKYREGTIHAYEHLIVSLENEFCFTNE